MPNSTKVYLVGAGPGDPDLLTRKAQRLLEEADIVLHDDLVSPPILALVRKASLVNVGKRCGKKKITQAEINERMIEAAENGLKVVRLKSGDPGIFGRLSEELDALEAARIPYEVVPGVTAGMAAAALLGVSLTHRRSGGRVVFASGHPAHADEPEAKTDWKSLAQANATLVIYMPGHDFAEMQRELLEAGLPPMTPAIIVSRATTSEERRYDATLAELHALPAAPAPSVLLIGQALRRHRSSAKALAAKAIALALDDAPTLLSKK